MGRLDLLFALTENASAAVYSQGGGPLLELLTSMEPWKWVADADQEQARILVQELARTLARPYGAAYGVDLPKVTKALASFRTTKDPAKAQKALDVAMDTRSSRSPGTWRPPNARCGT